VLLAYGGFITAGVVMIAAALFDMVDGRVARETQQVRCSAASSIRWWTRYSDLCCSWACWSTMLHHRYFYVC